MNLGNSSGTDGNWQWPALLAERIPTEWLEKAGWVVATDRDAVASVDLLDAHARRLVAGNAGPAKPVPQLAPNEDELVALNRLAEHVAYTVRPVYPAPGFRKELRRALLYTHRQQAARRRIFAHPLFEKEPMDRTLLERMESNSLWFWQIAATLPVLIAVAALIWRYTRRSTEQVDELAA